MCDCPEASKVRYAAATLQDAALTWWNQQVARLGLQVANATPWEDFKTLMKGAYCPRSEIQKLENEFWNLKMEGSEIETYTTRSHELASLCPQMVDQPYKRIEKYIEGLAAEIQSDVLTSNPTTIQDAILLAHKLTDLAVTQGKLPKRGALATASVTDNNKRKWENSNNKQSSSSQPVQQSRKFDNSRTYTPSSSTQNNQGGYLGNSPKCDKCNRHHYGSCGKNNCQRCGKYGHAAKDYRGELMDKQQRQHQGTTRGCFECGKEGHFKKDCPQLNKKENGNNNNGGNNDEYVARGRAYVIGSRLKD